MQGAYTCRILQYNFLYYHPLTTLKTGLELVRNWSEPQPVQTGLETTKNHRRPPWTGFYQFSLVFWGFSKYKDRSQSQSCQKKPKDRTRLDFQALAATSNSAFPQDLGAFPAHASWLQIDLGKFAHLTTMEAIDNCTVFIFHIVQSYVDAHGSLTFVSSCQWLIDSCDAQFFLLLIDPIPPKPEVHLQVVTMA